MSENAYQRQRKSQVIAQRTAEKAHRESLVSVMDAATLWFTLIEVLEETVKTRVYLGHIDRAGRAQMALDAAVELKLRGTQLQLDV